MLYSIAERGDDESLFFSHIQYKDLRDAMDNAPRWIKPEALKSRAAQMLPQEFAQQHLNQWTSGQSSLFPPDILDKCKDTVSWLPCWENDFMTGCLDSFDVIEKTQVDQFGVNRHNPPR